MTPCAVSGCSNRAARGPYCWTHIKRIKRGTSLEREVRGYRMTKAEKLGRAIARYSAAEGDVEFRRADQLVQKYAGAGVRKDVARFVRETARQMLREMTKKGDDK